ncbi:Rap1a/Tai family immunity protein [Tanticharoenia sakaeratensis]|uniref:Rap1a immunity protein domain-containing protein n=1 Tax=Tanticharoenia sakaeratensis NBRC 103193 TaxID=1231623 RepID=A0A0D6MIC5_9PROT|nr:Rap1a/Tai family immunity protein [Tanticharoenia sakaeratensis]GAN53367.1 hypothetical protein Tasa_009_162 [Tanticharoenia sakaeratensis NBRC 103193]GBQ20851.1 hypothetical protein AA103193_1526 [Tanticharoenia sakaeratensis NBRC 103193]
MKRAILAATLLAAAGLGGTAHAQRVSPLKAGRFMQMCSTPALVGACDAYITGMTDAVALGKVDASHEGDKSAKAGFCVPDSQTGPQMRGLVTAWLRAHADVLGKPVGEGVFAALHDSYPCHGSAP